MYLDAILFISSAAFAAVMVISVTYLMLSQRRSRMYTEALKQKSEGVDAITTALFKTGAPAESRYVSVINQYLPASSPPAPVYRENAAEGFDPSAIAGDYVIEREMTGGIMSRNFLVRSLKLGDPLFMKFIPGGYGGLAYEVDILKSLNHISLPKIIDVFHREEGVYLIETRVEGVPLEKVKQAGFKISQYALADWFEQIAQALKYLHDFQPSPIYHLDLKPGSIMLTHDNRIVLLDFGITRRYGEDTSGIPGGIAADARTDLYSLGVIMFELATGRPLTLDNMSILKNSVSEEFEAIIKKCLSTDPNGRYQNAGMLLDDLRVIKGTKQKMARLLFLRRLAVIAATLSLIISGGTYAGGYYLYNEESAAILSAQPTIITVSLQQSSDLTVSKRMADGRQVYLDSEQIEWEYSRDNIARVSGGRVSGINEGQTVIRGRYRDKEIDLLVRVVRPVDGLIDVSQWYEQGRYVSLYAGLDGSVRADGLLEAANFMSPESISADDDGTIYVSDAGEIRVISGTSVSTLPIPVDYIKAAMVRCYENELYLLSAPWQDGDRHYYTLARLDAGGVKAVYVADALYTAIEDFGFGGGLLYFIDRNDGLGGVFLKSLNLNDVNDINTLCMLPSGSVSLAVANNRDIYIGNKDTGIIQVYRGGELSYFAGIKGERAFIDGDSPRFYSPQRLEHRDGYLYVWDFNTLRRIEAVRGVAGQCTTLAGMASPDYNMELDASRSPAEDVILPFGSLMDFAVTGKGILLSDPKRGVIWRIEGIK